MARCRDNRSRKTDRLTWHIKKRVCLLITRIVRLIWFDHSCETVSVYICIRFLVGDLADKWTFNLIDISPFRHFFSLVEYFQCNRWPTAEDGEGSNVRSKGVLDHPPDPSLVAFYCQSNSRWDTRIVNPSYSLLLSIFLLSLPLLITRQLCLAPTTSTIEHNGSDTINTRQESRQRFLFRVEIQKNGLIAGYHSNWKSDFSVGYRGKREMEMNSRDMHLERECPEVDYSFT